MPSGKNTPPIRSKTHLLSRPHLRRSFLRVLLILGLPLLGALFPAALPAQESSLGEARIYRREGLYPQAYLEYQRYLFLCRQTQKTPEPRVFLELSRTCLARGQYDKSMAYLDTYQAAGGKPSRDVFLHELQVILAAPSSDLVRFRLYSMDIKAEQQYPDLSIPVKILNLQYALENNDWENTLFFLKGLEETETLSSDQSKALQEQVQTLKTVQVKSPRTAWILSLLVPGAGQLYAGYPGEAVNALAINGSMVYLSWFSLSEGHWGDFFAWELNSLVKFYKGNLSIAKDLAQKRNQLKRRQLKTGISQRLRLLFGNNIRSDLDFIHSQ